MGHSVINFQGRQQRLHDTLVEFAVALMTAVEPTLPDSTLRDRQALRVALAQWADAFVNTGPGCIDRPLDRDLADPVRRQDVVRFLAESRAHLVTAAGPTSPGEAPAPAPTSDYPLGTNVPGFGRFKLGTFHWHGRADFPTLGGQCAVSICHGGYSGSPPPSPRQVAALEQLRERLTPENVARMKQMAFDYLRTCWDEIKRHHPHGTNAEALGAMRPDRVKGPEDAWAASGPKTILIPIYRDADPRNVTFVGWVWEWDYQDVHCILVDGEPVGVTDGQDDSF